MKPVKQPPKHPFPFRKPHHGAPVRNRIHQHGLPGTKNRRHDPTVSGSARQHDAPPEKELQRQWVPAITPARQHDTSPGQKQRPCGTMAAWRISLAAIVCLLFSAPAIYAESPLLWRGSVESDQRMMLRDERDWAWNENRLDLTMERRSQQLRVTANVWLRHLGPSVVTSSGDLFDKDRVSPWNLDIRELYLDVPGFLSDKLDMRVGRQRIAWGTADRFNPTDNLNPPDLEDLLDFGRANGSDAISLQWWFNHQNSLQLVHIARFQPANMPLGPFSDLFALEFVLPTLHGDIPISIENKSVNLPPNNLGEGSTLAARFSTFILNTDLSISYVYGRDYLPLPDSIHIEMDQPTGEFHSSARLVYPRHHVIGADMAGSIGRLGIWAEAGVFIPEREMRTEVIVEPFDWHEEMVALKKEAYLKFVLGCDYSFSGGTYANIQYVRGFFHEGGRDGLNDYLILQTERDLLRYHLRIQPLAGGVTVSDWDDPKNHYAWFYSPEITYHGIDNLEISLGGFFSDGKGDHLFAGLKDKHMLRLKITASF